MRFLSTALLVCLFGKISSTENVKSDEKLMADVIDWARGQGANISKKIEIRSLDESLSGIFAKEPLEEGEIISSVPWDVILRSKKEETTWCSGIEAVYEALSKEDSEMNPYEKYLSRRSRHFLPAFWSEEGKELLAEVMGDDVNSLDFETMVEDQLHNQCGYEADDVDEKLLDALMIVVTRAEGPKLQHLVPFNDNINHQNGKFFNADPHVEEGKAFKLVATRRIEAGEEVHNSYNQCEWCRYYRNPSSPYNYYVTPQLYALYGFVEALPQRWVFPEYRLLFDLVSAENGGDEVKFAVPPSEAGLKFVRREVSRLSALEKQFEAKASIIPANEMQSIRHYHDSVLHALIKAFEHADGNTSEDVWEWGKYWYWEDEEGSQPGECVNETLLST